MLASITQLRPRVGSFDEALTAFRAARLRRCLSELNGIDSVAAATLRARTFLRLENPQEAVLAAHHPAAESFREKGELALLRAVAHARLGDADCSHAAFLDANVYGISSTDVALEAEVEFYKGLTAFADGALEEGRTACRSGLTIACAPRTFGKTGGIVPLEHVVSRTQELLGVIDAADGRYHDQLPYARAALATLDSCTISDVYQEGFALRNLAILARDFDLTDDTAVLAARVTSHAWTEDVSQIHLTTVEALGWCSALRGDIVEALRLFRRAASVASSDAEHVLVAVDRALLAREFGHRPMAIEEIEHALTLADGCDWEKAAGDYRVALLALAQAAAPIAPARAREMLNRYVHIRKSMDARFAARVEARTRAEETYTHGVVLRAEGRLAASTEQLRSAFETWQSIGYEWRAGRAALELTELNAGDVFRLAVQRELRRRPVSVFASRARLVA